jgi:pilus assembly protein Flp/PilA
MGKLKKFKMIMNNEKGQTLAEYGLLIALIAVACLIVLGTLGKNIHAKFKDVSKEIGGAEAIR